LFGIAFAFQANLSFRTALRSTMQVGTDGFVFGFSLFLLCFYTYAFVISFFCYREFKGLAQ